MAATYDIILTQDTTAHNHMLLHQGNKKAWHVKDAPLLPDTIIVGEASTANISPDREIQITQNDWRNGFSDLVLSDSRKYYKSENCDARFKGKVILSPKQLADIAYSGTAYAPMSNAGFEEATGTVLHNWVVDAGTGIRFATNPQSGSYCAKIGSDDAQISQELMWDNSLRGKTITFTAQLKAGAADSVKIGIADGTDTTWSDAYTSTSWGEGSVARELAGGATKLQLLIYATDADNYVYADTCTVTGAYKARGNCTKIVEFGSDIIVASGSKLCKLDTTFVEQADFIKTITDLCVYGSNLYIAVGNSDNFWYTSDLTTFTQT